MAQNGVNYNINNRFFSILSQYLSFKTRIIKKSINYLNNELLSKVLTDLLVKASNQEFI